MEFPISAEVTPMELIYVPEARVVINSNPDYYSEKKLEVRTASELGRMWRDSETYHRRMVTAEGAIGHAEQYIKENYEDIGEEHVKELAGLLGFDLSTSVEVEFNVTVKATLTLPIGMEVNELSEYDFDLELSYNGRDEIEIEDTNIDIISIEED